MSPLARTHTPRDSYRMNSSGLLRSFVLFGGLSVVPGAPAVLDAQVLTSPGEVRLDERLPEVLDSIVAGGIAAGASPGAALAVGRWGRTVHLRGYGRTDHDPRSPAVDDSTIWDMASLTKVIATTTAAMLLEEDGLLDIDRPVRDYLPEFDAPDKAAITVRMLLVHTGGLEAFAPLWQTLRGPQAYLEAINRRPIEAPPGTRMRYSDWDFILLAMIVERLAGEPLDAFLQRRVWTPLDMRDTGFNPSDALRSRIAPTEVDTSRGGLVHGFVHDENAWALGGVAGHAGLFSSARDLVRFAAMLLAGGRANGDWLLSPTTLARWTARQEPGSSRALGWDTPSPPSSAGRHFSPRSFGHTGFTGTSIWVDPERGLFVILLTSRVNPTRANQLHTPLRRAVADAVQRAVLDAPLIDWEAAHGATAERGRGGGR
jgi:CubicO group peptidase (beta-lactamase class C family)